MRSGFKFDENLVLPGTEREAVTMRNRLTTILKEANAELRRKPKISTLYLVLRALVIITMIAQFSNQNYENVFLCILTLLLLLFPTFLERRLNIDLPNTLEIIIMLFIFAAEILGEIREFYITYPYWDTILHTINGFLCAAIGFSLVDLFNRDKHFSLSLSPLFIAVMAFCFSMTIGIIWEFFEFFMDYFFLLDMQKDTVVSQFSSVMLDPTGGNRPVTIQGITDVIVIAGGEEIPLGLGGYLDIGIIDTMIDLLVNFVGATIFSMIGYVYVKSRGEGKFAKRFIPQVLSEEAEQDAMSEESAE